MDASASKAKAQCETHESVTDEPAQVRREWGLRRDTGKPKPTAFAIRLIGKANEPELPTPHYMRELDVEAVDGFGAVLLTTDISEAQVFESAYAALECWRKQSKTRPLRDDGQPNRPLTAYTIEIVGVVEVAGKSIGGTLTGDLEAAE